MNFDYLLQEQKQQLYLQHLQQQQQQQLQHQHQDPLLSSGHPFQNSQEMAHSPIHNTVLSPQNHIPAQNHPLPTFNFAQAPSHAYDETVYMDEDTSHLEDMPPSAPIGTFDHPSSSAPQNNIFLSPKFLLNGVFGDGSIGQTPGSEANKFTSIDSLNFRPPTTFTQLNNSSNTNLSAVSSSPVESRALMQPKSSPPKDCTPQPGHLDLNPNSSNYVYFNRQPHLLSQSAQDKAAAIKLRLENYYQMLVTHAIERNQRRLDLEHKQQYEEAHLSDERKRRQLALLGKKELQFLRLRRTKLSLEDFTTVKVIGKGAFGEVRLVQKTDTGKIYAMKTLLKSEMYKKDQLAHVKAERDVLAGSDSPWVVSLYYSFQDSQYLYLIMEFLPGGDLMTMLIRWQIFTEDITRFYMAECVLAIEAIHKLGFIHRDIKPDNILVDVRGHIKLSDFGLLTGFHKTHDSNYYKKLLEKSGRESHLGPNQLTSLQAEGGRNSVMVDAIHLTMSNRQQMQTWRKLRRLMAYLTVGTPDYIAPEIFIHQGYGQECDWWLLGAIMFECLIGWPPFCSETPHETYRKIMNWRETLQIPEDIHLLPEAEDLIRRLLTSSDERIGRFEGAAELKRHPFFRGVDWNTIRHVDAPFIPKLRLITDTRFFPTDELENVPDAPSEHRHEGQEAMPQSSNPKEDLPFIGYTYLRFDYLTRKNAL